MPNPNVRRRRKRRDAMKKKVKKERRTEKILRRRCGARVCSFEPNAHPTPFTEKSERFQREREYSREKKTDAKYARCLLGWMLLTTDLQNSQRAHKRMKMTEKHFHLTLSVHLVDSIGQPTLLS